MLSMSLTILKPLNDFLTSLRLRKTNYSGQNYAFTRSMAINSDWRLEKIDLESSQMKSSHASRIITRMFLGLPGYAKRFFGGSLRLIKTNWSEEIRHLYKVCIFQFGSLVLKYWQMTFKIKWRYGFWNIMTM